MRDSPALPYVLAFVAGVVLWGATAAVEGRSEPWDSGLFWTLSYPLAILFAGMFGYFFPRRPWRWALLLVLSQLAIMLPNADDMGLLPLGLVLLAILSVPAMGAAILGGWLGRRRTNR